MLKCRHNLSMLFNIDNKLFLKVIYFKKLNQSKIFLTQTKSMKDMKQKLNKYIPKNEVAHKKFYYEISDFNMKLKFAR